ncbi:hypothetical protein ACFQZZ_17085 [Nocardia sp. GCM10030253]|uniref:hypothetical protein n=1 Tax=Nocardia sp. GCM10030253 TaxID=3273404 RepID=UPI0036435A4D
MSVPQWTSVPQLSVPGAPQWTSVPQLSVPGTLGASACWPAGCPDPFPGCDPPCPCGPTGFPCTALELVGVTVIVIVTEVLVTVLDAGAPESDSFVVHAVIISSGVTTASITPVAARSRLSIRIIRALLLLLPQQPTIHPTRTEG